MRHWTSKDYKTMPWKNGGGSTTELAIFPEGANLDHFVWRLSTASVAQAGPFSYFSGIDRSLAILTGDGLMLKKDPGVISESASEEINILDRTSAPHRFRGEETYYAELMSGAVLDLNLMTRRDVCQHYMQRLYAGEHFVRAEDAQQILIYCAQGRALLDAGVSLVAQDLLLMDEEHEHGGIELRLKVEEESVVYLMRISFLNHADQGGAPYALG